MANPARERTGTLQVRPVLNETYIQFRERGPDEPLRSVDVVPHFSVDYDSQGNLAGIQSLRAEVHLKGVVNYRAFSQTRPGEYEGPIRVGQIGLILNRVAVTDPEAVNHPTFQDLRTQFRR